MRVVLPAALIFWGASTPCRAADTGAGTITTAFAGKGVSVAGTVEGFSASTRPTAPFSFMVKDATGAIRVAIWPNVFNRIQNKSAITDGAQVRVVGKISEFRDQAEIHIEDPTSLTFMGAGGSDVPQAVPAVPLPMTPAPGSASGSQTMPSFPSAGAPTGSSPAASAGAGKPGALQWFNDIPSGYKAAAEGKKKIMVFFYTNDNRNSKHYDDTVFSDATVKNLLRNNFAVIRLDFTQHSKEAYALHVFKAGTMVFYDSAGTALKKIEDRQAPPEFARELNQVIAATGAPAP